jgi:hypothetical protein
MAKYRSKVVEIEAYQWMPNAPPQTLPMWLVDHILTRPEAFNEATGELTIRTLEGDMRAAPGDYIIRGMEGELYPCKPSIFEKKYEAV